MIVHHEIDNLLELIKVKQKEMYEKAKNYGMTDERVIMCSQALDRLLNKYQSRS